jgi:hypothetical protein
LATPAAVGLLATGTLAWIVYTCIQRSRSPLERERRRRIKLHVNGRLTQVTIFQADQAVIQYGYEIAGVAYDTTQDISSLTGFLPRPACQLIGSATAKYDPRNPANSIILCEHWQGFPDKLTPER